VPWELTNLDSYCRQVGRKPAVVLWYQSWGPYDQGRFPTSQARLLYLQGYAQLLTWEPQDYRYGSDQPDFSLDAILSGEHDAYVRSYARSIKASGVPIYLRLAHEMNGAWYPWGEGINANTPEKYRLMWQHVRAIFDQEGVTNVKWVFSPSVKAPVWGSTTPYEAYYPGDSYVDWTALDGYNFAGSRGLAWYSFEEVFGPSYDEILSVAPSKPFMVAETASDETGGDKARWITDMKQVIPTRFPALKALVWFNQDEGPARLRVDSSAGALEAYKEYVNDAYYQARSP